MLKGIKKLLNNDKKGAKPLSSSPEAIKEIFGGTPSHHHEWTVVGKTYAPPSNLSFTNGQMSISPQSFEKLVLGVTTVLWECPCGETKKDELLGSDEDLLESIINKAEKIGPQFVDRRGKSFIISEWNLPPDQSRIPIR